MQDEDYDKQSQLLEKFIENSDVRAFKQMLQLNNNFSQSLSKRSISNGNRYLSESFKVKSHHHNHYNGKNIYNLYNYQDSISNSNNYNFGLNFNDDSNYNSNEIGNYKLNFHSFLQDPAYKNKSMKGNYKWATMKFNMMKANLAKRKGIVNYELPKFENRPGYNRMEMNGKLIVGGEENKVINRNGNIINFRTNEENNINTNSEIGGIDRISEIITTGNMAKTPHPGARQVHGHIYKKDTMKKKYSGKINLSLNNNGGSSSNVVHNINL